MKIKDLLHAWEQAVDEATVKQQHADELGEMLGVRAGLKAGGTWDPKGTGCFCTWMTCHDGTSCQDHCASLKDPDGCCGDCG